MNNNNKNGILNDIRLPNMNSSAIFAYIIVYTFHNSVHI